MTAAEQHSGKQVIRACLLLKPSHDRLKVCTQLAQRSVGSVHVWKFCCISTMSCRAKSTITPALNKRARVKTADAEHRHTAGTQRLALRMVFQDLLAVWNLARRLRTSTIISKRCATRKCVEGARHRCDQPAWPKKEAHRKAGTAQSAVETCTR